jgi:hypothetical protein
MRYGFASLAFASTPWQRPSLEALRLCARAPACATVVARVDNFVVRQSEDRYVISVPRRKLFMSGERCFPMIAGSLPCKSKRSLACTDAWASFSFHPGENHARPSHPSPDFAPSCPDQQNCRWPVHTPSPEVILDRCKKRTSRSGVRVAELRLDIYRFTTFTKSHRLCLPIVH